MLQPLNNPIRNLLGFKLKERLVVDPANCSEAKIENKKVICAPFGRLLAEIPIPRFCLEQIWKVDKRIPLVDNRLIAATEP